MDSCQRKGRRLSPSASCIFFKATAPLLVATLLGLSGAVAQVNNAPGGGFATNELPDVSLSEADPSVQSGATGVPPLQIFGAIDLSETYTTNAGGYTGASLSSPDTYTRANLQLGLRYQTRRAQVFANYSLVGDYYAKFHALNQYVNYLSFASTVNVIPDHFLVNATAFATPASLTRLGAISAGGEIVSRSNSTNVYGYQVQPQYVQRYRDIVTSTTSLSQGGVYFALPSTLTATSGPVAPRVQDSTLLNLTQRFTSGDYFGRLLWSLSGTYDKLDMQSFSQTQRAGVGELEYAFNRSFALLASGGYSSLTATIPLSRSLSGPQALGGFRFTPSPSFSLTARGGVRNNLPTYLAAFHWDIGARTSIDGQLNDMITTPQGSILGGLSGFGTSLLSPTSAFSTPGLTPQFGITSPLLPQGLALDNSIYHERVATLTFSHSSERMAYQLMLFGNKRDQQNIVPGSVQKSSLYGLSANIQRQLWSNLSGNVSGSYTYAEEFGGHDQIFLGTVGLTYAISERWSVYALNRYLHRTAANIANISTIPLSDKEVVVGIRHNF